MHCPCGNVIAPALRVDQPVEVEVDPLMDTVFADAEQAAQKREVCPRCGHVTPGQIMTCPKCGFDQRLGGGHSGGGGAYARTVAAGLDAPGGQLMAALDDLRDRITPCVLILAGVATSGYVLLTEDRDTALPRLGMNLAAVLFTTIFAMFACSRTARVLNFRFPSGGYRLLKFAAVCIAVAGIGGYLNNEVYLGLGVVASLALSVWAIRYLLGITWLGASYFGAVIVAVDSIMQLVVYLTWHYAEPYLQNFVA